jgi:hypothetical protein
MVLYDLYTGLLESHGQRKRSRYCIESSIIFNLLFYLKKNEENSFAQKHHVVHTKTLWLKKTALDFV